MSNVTPNEQLAEAVVEALLENDLIKDSRRARVKKALCAGTAKSSEWIIWAEDFIQEETDDVDEEVASVEQPDT